MVGGRSPLAEGRAVGASYFQEGRYGCRHDPSGVQPIQVKPQCPPAGVLSRGSVCSVFILAQRAVPPPRGLGVRQVFPCDTV